MLKTPRFLALAFAGAVLFLAGCAAPPPPLPLLKLGVIVFDYRLEPNLEGLSTDKGAELAARDLNTAGTLRIELEKLYVTTAPEASVEAVRQLANRRGVAAIVGPPTSSQAIPAGQAAEEAKIPLLSAVSTNPQTTRGRSWVFRMTYLDPAQARAQVDAALQLFPKGTASLIWVASEPSASLQSQVIQQGWTAAGRSLRRALAESLDPAALEASIRNGGPWTDAVVFLPTSSEFAENAATLLRAAGFQGRFVGGDGWDRERFRGLPAFEGGLMTTDYWSGQQTPANQKFVADYTALAGRPPGDTAALTYDAVLVLAQAALRTGRTDSEGLRQGLLDAKPYEGVAGQYQFPGTGDPTREVFLLSFRGGQIVSGTSP